MFLSVTEAHRSMVYDNGGGTGAVHRSAHVVFECKPRSHSNADEGEVNASNRFHTGEKVTLCSTGIYVTNIGLAGGYASSPQGLHETENLRKVKRPAIWVSR